MKSIVEKKELNGDRISSKQQLYVRIGEELHVSPETVKYWQRDKSSGPDSRTPELLDELESYLGYPKGALQKEIKIEEEKTEDSVMNIKTDAAFNKLMSHFLERLQELDEKIDQFAEQELRTYLLG